MSIRLRIYSRPPSLTVPLNECGSNEQTARGLPSVQVWPLQEPQKHSKISEFHPLQQMLLYIHLGSESKNQKDKNAKSGKQFTNRQ